MGFLLDLIDIIWSVIKLCLCYIGVIVLMIIVTLLLFTFCVMPSMNNCYKGNKIFEYEDLNGNIGNATNCQFSDAGDYSRKGGQGQPICFIGNKVIAVKWYEDKTEYGNCYKLMWEE